LNVSPEFLWPWSINCVSPVWGFQNWTPLSFDPLMTHSASGVIATLRTKSWPGVSCAFQDCYAPALTAHLVTLERSQQPSTFCHVASHHSSVVRRQPPHFDSFVQTAANQGLPIWSECNRVDAVFMSSLAIKSCDYITTADVPYSDTLIKRASCDIVAPGRNSYRCDTILDTKVGHLAVILNIPDADGVVATARGDVPSIAGEI